MTGERNPSLKVTEIFYSIQGESTAQGLPCVFVRLTGCPLRCRWCDTTYAFSGGEALTQDQILDRVSRYGCDLVEVTGGEPLSQPGCLPLLRRLADQGYKVLLETSGALSIDGVDPRVRIVMDLKCPDSGEEQRNLWANLDRLKSTDEIKFVLASRRDYTWARDVITRLDLAARHPLLFSPVWGELDATMLAGWILEDRIRPRLQIQLHKVLFGAETRGV